MTDQPIQRAGMYLRVSTLRQETENQILGTVRFIEANGWDRVELVDHGSGKDAEREKFKQLFEMAARREIDVVVVWALDRFSREGVAETFAHIKALHDHGVGFVSVTEPQFRTTGPAGELMIAVAAWIAKQERVRLRERVVAGLERVKIRQDDGTYIWRTKTGNPPGRKRRIFDHEAVRQLREAGKSFSAIAAELRVGETTVRRACA